MKALVANDYGQPSNLEVTDVPDPSPGPDQLLVRMEAAALNPFDLKLITGALRDVMPLTFPHLIGMDGSGTVADLGDAVSGFSTGDAIVGFFGATPGTIAEYAVIDQGPAVTLRPAELDAVHAAALPESGLTALTLLRAAELQPGESVLVVGATGGVGMFVVQLAAAEGAHVIATASGDDVDYVRSLGASEVVEYKGADPIEETLRLHPDGVDAIIDLVSMGEGVVASARAAREGGRVVSSLDGPDDLGRGVATLYISMTPHPGDLERLVGQAAEGALKIEVTRTYTLSESPQAMADFAQRHTRGKLVITL
jgi:NADPH:quinone reductase-like Zn-dependent oxidoreductase